MVNKRKTQKSKFEYHFCFELKREILRLYDEAQPISQRQAATFVSEKIHRPLARNSLQDIVKNRAKIENGCIRNPET